MKEYDAYLFDADGTLIDTKELIYRSFRHMAETVEVTLPDRKAVEATIGLPVWTQVGMFLGDANTPEMLEKAVGIYGGYMEKVYMDYLKLFPGAMDCLADLRRRGKLLAIVTSRRRQSLARFTGHLGLTDYFSVIVTADDTAKHKPDPEPAQLALDRLGVKDAARAVFIGDAGFDMLCGKGAGTDTAFVAWGGNNHHELPQPPDFVAESFTDLLPDSKSH